MQKLSKEDDKLHFSDDYLLAYRVHDDFAIFLDKNIYLYHLIPKDETDTKIIPWYYADSRLCIGDTWWYKDEKILHDVQNLSVIEFLDKYKGY